MARVKYYNSNKGQWEYADNAYSGGSAPTEAGDYTIPDYWKTAVDNTIAKVKSLQDAGGRDVVNFLWFSDLHYGDNAEKIKYVGHLCAALMDQCNIPLVINCGDTMSSSPLASESALLTNLDNGAELLSPIDPAGYAQIYGNHDDVWGQYTANESTVSYVNKVAPEKMWSRVFRRQAKDLHRVFGGNGTYFYIDNVHQKVRFVCLNSHYYDGAEITDGTTKIMTTGFGAEQLDWLKNTALNVEEEWYVVIATHVPPTAEPINGNTYYLSQLSDGADFRTIINDTAANLIGIFCGHCHASSIVTDDLPCPIITVTTAGGVPYDSTEGARVAGTTSETAIDVVSVNLSGKKINITRLGLGSDRICGFAGQSIVTHSIVNDLTYVNSNKPDNVIESGNSYTAILSAYDGYEIDTVTITMEGVDVTADVYSGGGTIHVASVTGDLVIVATAIQTNVETNYTNLADPTSADWSNDDRLSSSGEPKGSGSYAGGVVTNWIEAAKGDVIRIKGINIADTTGGYAVMKENDGNLQAAKPSSYTDGFVQDENGVWTFTVWQLSPSGTLYGDTCQAVRISGMLTADSVNDVVITKNEEIV